MANESVEMLKMASGERSLLPSNRLKVISVDKAHSKWGVGSRHTLGPTGNEVELLFKGNSLLCQSVTIVEQSICSAMEKVQAAVEDKRSALLADLYRETDSVALSSRKGEREVPLVVALDIDLATILDNIRRMGTVYTKFVDENMADAAVAASVSAASARPLRGLAGDPFLCVFATGQQSGNVILWDALTGRQLYREPFVGSSVRSLIGACVDSSDSNGDQSFLLVAGGRERRITLWDTDQLDKAHLEGHNSEVLATCFLHSPCGVRIATSAFDYTIKIWDSRTTKCLASWYTRQTVVFSLCQVDSAADQIAGGCDDGVVRVWDIATGSVIHSLQGHLGRAWTVCSVDPTRSLVASGGADKNIAVWDGKDGALLEVWLAHSDWVQSLCVFQTGDQNILASGSNDGTVRLWALQTDAKPAHRQLWPSFVSMSHIQGHCLAVLTGHSDAVTAVCTLLTPKGRVVVSGARDGKVCVWNAQNGKMIGSFSTDDSAVLSMCPMDTDFKIGRGYDWHHMVKGGV